MSLPDPDSGRSAGSSGSGGSKSAKPVGGWEWGDKFTFDASAISVDSRRSCSVSPHAVAHGCSVLGVKKSVGGGGGIDGGDDDWIDWEASFEPNRVCRVASNDDGSVVVASTAAGTVSLMSGRDGGMLATRRVYSVEEGELMRCIKQCGPLNYSRIRLFTDRWYIKIVERPMERPSNNQ